MRTRLVLASVSVLALLAASCGTQRKLGEVRSSLMRANLSLPPDRGAAFSSSAGSPRHRDTLFIRDDSGRDLIVMRTMKVDGEVMAGEVLDAAVVTARFRNVAERHGRIDLEFDVIVPERMMDPRWKLRFDPDMFILSDSVRLEPVFITGSGYRKGQERGEALFARYLRGIVTDTTAFRWAWQLDLFLERNIPQVYAFARDTSMVDVDRFEAIREAEERAYMSRTGVTVKEAVDHYTVWLLRHRNDRKISRIAKMRRRYIKDPIVREGMRLDTVIREVNGDFRYRYVQTVRTRPKLRKIDIVLSGEIYDSGRPVYAIPPCDPLTFYVSSVSALVSDEPRYLTKVISRKVEANTACYISFAAGKADIDEDMGNNRTETGRIKDNLRAIMADGRFDLDSICVTAFASPEGTVRANGRLSARRAEAAGKYFRNYLRHLQDSLRFEAGYALDLSADGRQEGRMRSAYRARDIQFSSRNGGENWSMLDWLVESDTLLSPAEKADYASLSGAFPEDPDAREDALRARPFYRQLRERLYPYCRVVAFDFHMHRTGMLKDTVHTTVLDSVYMAGVQYIRDRDYDAALAILQEYRDYNCAIALLALDRNLSAMQILEGLERTPRVNYLLAILHSRRDDDQAAVQCYLDACAKDRSFVNRGNLDPEISRLIRDYGLNRDDPEDDINY